MDVAPAWTDGLVGRLLCGRYQTHAVLGAGGMGAVLRATHQGTGRVVAVKVMRPELARDAELVRRFHREARAAASVGCKGVVDVLDLDIDDGVGPIIVLELIAGESLHARILRLKGLDPATTIRIAMDVATTLREVHAKGIVHRDLKPANVLLVDDADGVRTKLVDFGVARVETAMRTGALTMPGIALGTPRFMSPEQARGEADVDARSDLYSLGAMMHFMAHGRPPYADVKSDDVFRAVLLGPPPALLAVAPETPRGLAAIVARAMERDRNARYQSAGEIVSALRALDDVPETRVEEAPRAQPSVQRPPQPVRMGKMWRAAAVLALAIVAAAIAAGGAWHFQLGPFAQHEDASTTPAVARQRLHAGIAHARELLAASDPDRALKDLSAEVARAESQGFEVDVPLGALRAEAHLVLALASVRAVPAAGACPDRVRQLDAALDVARRQIVAARKGGDPPACDFAMLARAELESGEAIARAADDSIGQCSSAATRAYTQAAHHAALVTDASSDCGRSAADVRARASMLLALPPATQPGTGTGVTITPLPGPGMEPAGQ